MKKNKESIIRIICAVILFIIIIVVILSMILRDNSKKSVDLGTTFNDIYEWKYEIADKKIVKLYKKNTFGDLEGKNNGIITERYIFKGLKKGKTTITFTQVNKNNKSWGIIKEYEAVVDKKLKLTINEKK